VAIHECFHLPAQMVEKYNQELMVAMSVATKIHTSPQAFGKIMPTVKPKDFIAYQFFNADDTRYEIHGGVREVYDGPLSLATLISEAVRAGAWNVDDVEAEMLTDRMKKFGIDPKSLKI